MTHLRHCGIEIPQRSSFLRTEVCYPFGWKHGRDRAVNRRSFITLLGGAAAAWPLAVHAQQAQKLYRIGLLNQGSGGSLGYTKLSLRASATWAGLKGKTSSLSVDTPNGATECLS